MIQPFIKLKHGLTCLNGVREFIAESDSKSPWRWKNSFDFKSLNPIPLSIFSNDPLFQLITDQNLYRGVLRTSPMTVYDWHTDDDRSAGINVLITPKAECPSVCVFRSSPTGKTKKVAEIVEVPYETGQPILINTKIDHMVMNFAGSRDMLTLSFPKNISYFSAVTILRKMDLV